MDADKFIEEIKRILKVENIDWLQREKIIELLEEFKRTNR